MTTIPSKTLYSLAITISPIPYKKEVLTPLQQFDLRGPPLWSILKDFSNYYFAAELTPTNAYIHFHGIINIMNSEEKKKWVTRSLRSLRQKMGNTLVKLIADEENAVKWKTYIDKDKELFASIFKNRVNEFTPALAPKYKEIKYLIRKGICLDLDENVVITKSRIVRTYNQSKKIKINNKTINTLIHTKTLKANIEI